MLYLQLADFSAVSLSSGPGTVRLKFEKFAKIPRIILVSKYIRKVSSYHVRGMTLNGMTILS